MKNIAVSCVGKLKEKYFSDAVAEYQKRLGRFCKLTVSELDDSPHPDAIKRESDSIEKTFAQGEYRILCDAGGELVSSEELAEIIDKAFVSGKNAVRFIIGGSCGVDNRIRKAADKRVSFGRVTYPHQLMRVILLEQIYRAMTITAGMPYHK